MVVVPGVTPIARPAVLTEAIPGALLLHVPDGVTFASAAVLPGPLAQMVDAPVMGYTCGVESILRMSLALLVSPPAIL